MKLFDSYKASFKDFCYFQFSIKNIYYVIPIGQKPHLIIQHILIFDQMYYFLSFSKNGF